MNNISYKTIDKNSWSRKVYCELFKNSLNPFYCISFDLDITHFYYAVKKKQLSFTLSLIYAVSKCADDIENFRYRFKDNEVILLDHTDVSFSYINDDSDLFKQINAKMYDSLDEFIEKTKNIIDYQNVPFTTPPNDRMYIFSSMPWVPLNYISHTYSGNKNNSSPMFDWGKYSVIDNKVSLTFSVQVHHSFVDGIHIGQFYTTLQKRLNLF